NQLTPDSFNWSAPTRRAPPPQPDTHSRLVTCRWSQYRHTAPPAGVFSLRRSVRQRITRSRGAGIPPTHGSSRHGAPPCGVVLTVIFRKAQGERSEERRVGKEWRSG